MSTIDPERELRRLAEVYSNQTDDELLQSAQNRSALTDIAQRALDDELHRRKLIPSAATSSDEVEYREMVTIAKYRDLPEALLAQGNLNSSGIETVLLDENLVRLDWLWSNAVGGIKLQVKSEDAAEATEILNEPIPETIEFGGTGTIASRNAPSANRWM